MTSSAICTILATYQDVADHQQPAYKAAFMKGSSPKTIKLGLMDYVVMSMTVVRREQQYAKISETTTSTSNFIIYQSPE